MKMAVTSLAVMVMILSGAVTLSVDASQDLRSRRDVYSTRRPPVVVHANRYEARILREIGQNRHRISELRRENRRLSERLRYGSMRSERSILRRIERNDVKIHRLQRENRMLIRRLQRR